MKKRQLWIAAPVLLFLLVATLARYPNRFGATVIVQKLRGKATVSDRLAQHGSAVRARWQPYFAKKQLVYPPKRLILLGLKQEKRLEVYADAGDGSPRLVRELAVLGLSGKLGPKLRYGDSQVPEGLYQIESLNPNSAFHLALRVDYPNAFDRSQAMREGRSKLGGDIMIHGSNVSIGCLAMGDEIAEDLFVLAAEVGAQNIRVILSPVDFRVRDVPKEARHAAWVDDLYGEIKTAVKQLPRS